MPKKDTSINAFLVSPPPPTVDTVLRRRLESSKSVLLPPLQSEPMKRGEMKTFMTTFRDTPNPAAHFGADNESGVSSSLEQVWLKGMYSKPAEMRSIDASLVGQTNPETGLVWAPKYIPDRFERGRVQQPHVTLVQVDPAVFNITSDSFMTPAERRERHATFVNCKMGEEALRDAYRARNKLVRNCQKNYPHGVVGVTESPFSGEGAMSSVYADNRTELVQQQRVANRIGKGHGYHRPPVMQTLLAHSDNVASDRSRSGRADALRSSAPKPGPFPF